MWQLWGRNVTKIIFMISVRFYEISKELNNEEFATEEDKAYGIDYWAKLFKSTTWEELKILALEKNSTRTTHHAGYNRAKGYHHC